MNLEATTRNALSKEHASLSNYRWVAIKSIDARCREARFFEKATCLNVLAVECGWFSFTFCLACWDHLFNFFSFHPFLWLYVHCTWLTHSTTILFLLLLKKKYKNWLSNLWRVIAVDKMAYSSTKESNAIWNEFWEQVTVAVKLHLSQGISKSEMWLFVKTNLL